MQPQRAQPRLPDWSCGEAGFSSNHRGPIPQQGRASQWALSGVCVQVESGVLALGGGEVRGRKAFNNKSQTQLCIHIIQRACCKHRTDQVSPSQAF